MDRAQIGPYEVIEEIGHGGMGIVYRGINPKTGASVALKVARTSGSMSASIRTEIRALRRLDHPGVVRILDHGVEGGAPWYAMEFLEGHSWHELNRELWPRRGAPPESTLDLDEFASHADQDSESSARSNIPASPAVRAAAANGRLDEVLRLAARVCAPLAMLHGRGVVHRDLKPANVFLRQDGSPVLVDLGLATRFGAHVGRERLEVAGLVAGTAQYMAPEQVRGQHVDARADLYALGVMLYESITGRVPFTAPTVHALLQAVVNDVPPIPSSLVDGVPPVVENLLLALLAKDPRDRIGYADDVSLLLGELVDVPAPDADTPGYLYRPGVAGREEVTNPLLARVDSARDGTGALVLIGGESGVGKTVLAAEIGRLAARRQITVVACECLPTLAMDVTLQEAVGAPLHPFRALLQFMSDACRAEGPAACDRVFGAHASVLARYETSLVSLPSHRRWPEPFALPAELARRRVFEALLCTLEAWIDAFGPLLVILDDIQWSDDLSLAFLSSLDREWLETRGLLLVCTYRSDELQDAHRALLARDVAHKVELGRLAEPAVARMVADMLALRGPPAPFVSFLFSQSEGNPFFVAEYLRVAVQEGLLIRASGRWRLPAESADFSALPQPGSLRALLDQRLSGLTPAARAVLEVAAVLGREPEVAHLLAVIGTGEDDVHEAIRELLDRQVLEVGVPGAVRFPHDKLREHAYARIPAAQTAELHRRAAEAIEQDGNGDSRPWALLSSHWQKAEVWPKAVDCLERAVEESLAQFSNGEARRQTETLITLGNKLSGGPGRLRAGRWRRFLADAALGQGAYVDGRRYAEEALQALDTPLPRSPVALAASLLVQVGWMTLRRVLPRAGVPDSPEARLVHRESLGIFAVLMDFFIYNNEPLTGIYAGIRVVAMGSPMGASKPLARALGLMGAILLATPFKAVGRAWRARALEMAALLDDPMTKSYAQIRIAASYIFTADWAECDRLLDEGLSVAVLAHDTRRQEEAHITLAFARYMKGHFDEALSESELVERTASERNDAQTASWARSGRAQALIRLGRAEEAEAILTQDLAWVDEAGTRTEQVLTYGILGLARLQRGDDAGARDAAERALDWLGREPIVLWFFAPATYAVAEVWLALWAAIPPADTAARSAAAASAKKATKLLRTLSGTFPVATAPSELAEARRLRTNGKAGAAEQAATRAKERAATDGLPYEEAQARLLLADLGVDGLENLTRARAILATCGAHTEAARVPREVA